MYLATWHFERHRSALRWKRIGLALWLFSLAACTQQVAVQRAPIPKQGTQGESTPGPGRVLKPKSVAPVPELKPPALASAPPAPESKLQPLLPQVPVWTQFRDHQGFPDCASLSPRAQKWRRTFSSQSAALAQIIDQNLPLINMVAAELEKRQLPIAFAMLPMIESQYVAHAAQGNRPAGIWQLMPQTARGLGVPLQPGYDGRIDYFRSTQAAVDLLVHLGTQFDNDWKLVDMAFNAGEFRVKNAIRKTRRKHPGQQIDLDAIGLSRITLHHLAKLEAMSCLLGDTDGLFAQRKDALGQTPLVALPLKESIRFEFIAHLAGIELAQLSQWNPAITAATTPEIASLHLLLPAAMAARAATALKHLPATTWASWQPVQAPIATPIESIALAGLADAVRHVNGLGAGQSVAEATGIVWLPADPNRAVRAASKAAPADLPARTMHTVIRGDSLWTLAKRYGVAIKRLMQWNGLNARSVLRPGQKIRIRSP